MAEPNNGNDFLLPRLLREVADYGADRMHRVWADDTIAGVHPYRAVCGYNASLSIEWGLAARHVIGSDRDGAVEFDWSQAYPDRKVYVQELDVLLHGAVIYRQTIALVDGARCWIPFPEPVQGGIGWQVTAWAAQVVGLANDLVHRTTDTLDYLRRADIKVVKVPPLAE